MCILHNKKIYDDILRQCDQIWKGLKTNTFFKAELYPINILMATLL